MIEPIENPEEKYKKESRKSALILTVIMLLMGSICFLFSSKTKKTVEKQNIETLEKKAIESEKYLSVIFDYARKTINVVSSMYEKKMTSADIDYRELKEIRLNTPFDYIRFVSKDGVAIDSEGRQFDVTDRKYYIDGIKGKSGIVPVKGSRYTSEFVFSAYAPLYYKGEIIGVLSGILSEKTLTELLQNSSSEIGIKTCICTIDGDIMASSGNDRWPYNLIQFFENKNVISEKTFEKVKAAFFEGEDILFPYKNETGEKNTAYITTNPEKNWIMVQSFPASITNKIVMEQNLNSLKMELACAILFLAYALYFITTEIKKRKKTDEISQKRLLKSSRNLVDTVSILSDRYYKVLKCNLDTRECDLIKLNIADDYAILYEDINAWFEKLYEANEIFKDDVKTVKEFFNLEKFKEQFLNGERHLSCTYRRHIGDEIRWVKLEVMKSSEFSEKTPFVIFYLTDINEDIQKELALKESYESAIKANRAKTQFLSAMSHDIRTPMHAIIGMTNIAGVHLDDTERVKECLQKITISSKHLLALINDVLDMSKIESGHIDLNLEEFNLAQLIENLLTMTREQINTKHHDLEVAITNIEHELVIGDSHRIQQVFMNMMSNAIKYTPEGGRIDISITEKSTQKHDVACYEFIFQDNGIGMSEEFVKRLFDPFSRAEDDERVRNIQGTGLGMSISKNIVQMMNGDIKVESELNKGTKFTVTIYLELQNHQESENYEKFTDLPILVIDDDRISCQYACDILMDFGMKPEYSLSGKEALALIEEKQARGEHYFAIIVDWKMPEMDGLETTKRIRELAGDEVPVIIISAYDWSQIESDARAIGANDFISKPLFKSRLNALFHRLTKSDENKEYTPQLAEFAQNDFSGKRVLLTEDIDLIAEMTTEILKMAHLEVEIAHNGKEAADKLAEVPDGYYDLVFMDIQMPIMNGYEAAKTIRSYDREYTKKVPIIAMSANTFSDDIVAAKNAGMNEHIGKPFEFDDLLKILNKWI